MGMFEGADQLRRAAIFSECRTWRYTLERYWDDSRARLLFVLLNPSTADAERDDPTNRRGMGFARSWGYGSCVFVNLFAFRSPDPDDLVDPIGVDGNLIDPVGPANNIHILTQAVLADRIVLAWGTKGRLDHRDEAVLRLLEPYELWCLGCTKHGYPRHPLYLRADTQLEQWNG